MLPAGVSWFVLQTQQRDGGAGVIPLSEQTTIGLGTIINDKYRLDRVLARGGQGVVFVAQHLQLDVSVAVKFLSHSYALDPTARGRFEREARAAVRLHTPHVVQVLDYGVEEEMPYIVMELLDGEDLAARLEREHRLSLHAASKILTQAARGLQQAHDLGLVHRDLKPGNLFLARTAEGEILKIVDFGIAKATRASMVGPGDATSEGLLLGSPRYMSPEQARGHSSVDHRSDLWSLAVIVYRAITGERPFEGATVLDILFNICKGARREPSQVVSTLPPAVDRFFERALAIEPASRFQTALEMAAEFARVVARSGSPEATEKTLVSATVPGEILTMPMPRPIEETLNVRGSVVSDIPPAPRARPRPRGWVVGAAITAVGIVCAAWVFRQGPTPPPEASDARTAPASLPPALPLPVTTPVDSAAPIDSPRAQPPASAVSSADAGAVTPARLAPPKSRPPSSGASKKRMEWGF